MQYQAGKQRPTGQATTASEEEPVRGAEGKYSLQGKSALVTGGSRGIGASIVARLERLGANVTWNSRSSVGQSMPAHGNAIVADLLSSEDRARLVSAAAGEGRLDILVNNAGLFHFGEIEDADMAAARELFDVSFWAPLDLIRLALPSLKHGKGSIINVSSVNAVRAQAGTTIYCAVKASLEMATRCLALELAPYGVRVNAIAPGPVPTRLLENALGGHKPTFLLDHIPLGRLGLTDDVAAAVAFLASDDASWITGQVIRVDGGMSC